MKEIKHITKSFFKGAYPAEKEKELQAYIFDKDKTDEVESAMKELWDETPSIRATDETLASFNELQRHLAPAKGSAYNLSHILKWGRIAALWLLTLIPASWAIYYAVDRHYARLTEIVEQVVPAGKTEQVILADGTTVWLNSGSVLIYPKQFSGSKREIYLSGEGYFEVARNEQKPFNVQTRFQHVEVLGTAFNLKAYPESKEIVTTLEHGSIAVSLLNKRNDRVVMQPDQCLTFDTTTDGYSVAEVKASTASKWREGELTFRNTPFEEIVYTLARHYGLKAELMNHNHTNNRLTFSLNKGESLDIALQLIKETISDVNFQINNDTLCVK